LQVAEKPNSKTNPFEVETIRDLVRLMSKHGLSELDLQDGEKKIRLKKEGLSAPVYAPIMQQQPAPVLQQPAQAHAAATAPAAVPSAAPAANKNLIDIKSPTPGTFYSQEKPGSPTYVAVGAKVNPKTVVCQIEAMKLFNEIFAECTGTIVEILIENKQPVEYGQVLFRVDPNG
jgi:acetyl-CoA carboxylase biotin carboxyl carrier protein